MDGIRHAQGRAMNTRRAAQIEADLPESAVVVDVGGGASPFARADYVLDGLPFDERCALDAGGAGRELRVTRDRWVQLDLCRREPWPFEDKFFDYAVCSHLLEDVRDPVWVCSELVRVAKAGYVETPSRIVEQSLGVEHPLYAGYYHHRWLVSASGNKLEFRPKVHLLHGLRGAIVADLGSSKTINADLADLQFEWTAAFEFEEMLEFDERRVREELCEFAARHRRLPGLTVKASGSQRERLGRALYFRRLRSGR